MANKKPTKLDPITKKLIIMLRDIIDKNYLEYEGSSISDWDYENITDFLEKALKRRDRIRDKKIAYQAVEDYLEGTSNGQS